MQENYEALISNHPLFCLLDDQSVHQLAECLSPVSIKASEIITTEGESFDSVYFIASGTAEVTRTLSTIEKQHVLRIEELTKGDVIGLSEEGFISQTGIHTDTVKALTSMHLLKLSLYAFLQFLQQPQIIYPDLKNTSEAFLLMHFIRSLHLFDNSSQEIIQTLAKMVKKIAFPAGTVIYKQGENVDGCYYILTGQVSILTLENNLLYIKTILNANQLVGEAEFLRKKLRNESARAESNCELLILDQEVVKQFIKRDSPSILKRLFSKILRKKHV